MNRQTRHLTISHTVSICATFDPFYSQKGVLAFFNGLIHVRSCACVTTLRCDQEFMAIDGGACGSSWTFAGV
jgi:hypothetical protein